MDKRTEAAETGHGATTEHGHGHHDETLPRPGDYVSPGEHAHPGYGEYIKIAVILAILTAIEVAIVYVEPLAPVLLPLLLILGIAKFALVVMFFMHLKFDNRLFSLLFTGPLLLMAAILLALIALFTAAVRVVP